jgi:hypothetical protein
MSYYRNYRRNSYPPVERVTDESIAPRLKTLLESKDIPENTIGFLQSLIEANEKYSGLTARQAEALKSIEQRFSAAAIVQRQAWSGEYNADRRSTAKICAEYYFVNPPYYRDLAEKVLNDLEFIPTERQWRALCENKYAKKVIAATTASPKYNVGDWVQGRANTRGEIRGRMMAIIETDAKPVTHAARGTKVYRVLPAGSPTTLLCEERDIKKAKKKA